MIASKRGPPVGRDLSPAAWIARPTMASWRDTSRTSGAREESGADTALVRKRKDIEWVDELFGTAGAALVRPDAAISQVPRAKRLVTLDELTSLLVPEPDGIPNPYGGWAARRGEDVELESYANHITKGARGFVIPPGTIATTVNAGFYHRSQILSRLFWGVVGHLMCVVP